MPVLPAPPGLTHEFPFGLRALPDRLPVRHLRLADVGTHPELPDHPVHQDLQVQLPHSREDRLARIRVGVHREGRILAHQLVQRKPQLLLVALGLRLHGDRNHRRRELDGLEHDGMLPIADRVAGRDVLEPDGGGDIAAVHFLDLLPLVGVHPQEPPHPFHRIPGGIVDPAPRLELPRVDPKEGQVPDEGVGHDLEDQAGEGLRVRSAPHRRGLPLPDDARHRWNVKRRREIGDNGIEQLLDPLVLERRPAQDGHELQPDRPLAQGPPKILLRDRLPLQVLFHQPVVGLRGRLDHLVPVGDRFRLVLRRDLLHVEVRPEGIVLEDKSLFRDQVDDASKLVLLAERYLHRNGHRVQPRAHHFQDPGEVRADPVHLVHKTDARHAVLVRLAPHRLRLRLHPFDRPENAHGAVEHPQAPLHLGGEIDVPGRVYDVDPVLLPEAGGGGRGDGDPALLLLLHPVHGGGTLVYLAQPVRNAGVIENTLRGRSLTRIDVGHDADISGSF